MGLIWTQTLTNHVDNDFQKHNLKKKSIKESGCDIETETLKNHVHQDFYLRGISKNINFNQILNIFHQ